MTFVWADTVSVVVPGRRTHFLFFWLSLEVSPGSFYLYNFFLFCMRPALDILDDYWNGWRSSRQRNRDIFSSRFSWSPRRGLLLLPQGWRGIGSQTIHPRKHSWRHKNRFWFNDTCNTCIFTANSSLRGSTLTEEPAPSRALFRSPGERIAFSSRFSSPIAVGRACRYIDFPGFFSGVKKNLEKKSERRRHIVFFSHRKNGRGLV